jgi:integrase/recombinase XerD
MFEQLFSQRAAVIHHHSSPSLAERLSYLSHLRETGHSRSRMRGVAWLLLSLTRHLPLDHAAISAADIEAAAEAWAATTRRSACCLHAGKREFVFHATKWLRLLGRLHEPQALQPFAEEMCVFMHFELRERGLAASTVERYRRYLLEFLVPIEGQNKKLCEVTLDDISSHLQAVAERKLKRTSITHHVAALRAFFRYAHSRGWCREGLAAIDAPRIYRLESLPRGPAWSDVQRLLASCAGDTPSEIRDHAMLLVVAVYGVRSVEVRHLRLEDIDWEREIVRIRRPKQRKSQQYPLVREVGAAILRYLREVRPKCALREIFVTRVQPYRPLTAPGFGTMVRNRLGRLGLTLPCYGPHALRHSCATHLLAEGVSLKEIADHLGHVSLAATQMYAKVDLPALREVGDLALTELVEYAARSEDAATPIQTRGSIDALHGVAAISLGGLL